MTIGQLCRQHKFSESEFETVLNNEGTIKLTGLFHNKISDSDAPRAVELFNHYLAEKEEARLTELAKTVLPKLMRETNDFFAVREEKSKHGAIIQTPVNMLQFGAYNGFSDQVISFTLHEDCFFYKIESKHNVYYSNYPVYETIEETKVLLSSIKSAEKVSFHQYSSVDPFKLTPTMTIGSDEKTLNFLHIHGVNKDWSLSRDFNAPALKIYKYIVAHSGMSDTEKVKALENIVIEDSPGVNMSLLGYYNSLSHPKEASVVGRAVAGGIIAGPAGAVVGAISAANKNAKIRSK